MAREATFQKELIRAALKAGFHPLELADEGKRSYNFGQTSFGAPKPYDLALVGKKWFVALELKDTDTISFNFSEVRTNQWDGLQAVVERGWPAAVVVNYYARLSPKMQERIAHPEPYLNEAHILPLQTIRKLQAEAYRGITVVDARKVGIEIPRIGDTEWNLKVAMTLLLLQSKTLRGLRK